MHRAGIALALVAAVSMVGCGAPDFMGTPLQNNGGVGAGGDTGGGSSSGGGSCVQLQPTDPSSLPACCAGVGAAHCVPSDKLPSNLSSQLSTCTGGYCVPDPFIRSGGAAPPKCKSLNAADGVCLSLCVPQVSMYKDLLPQDSCAADERCAPCVNPLNMMPSGACDIGKAQTCDPGSGSGGSGGNKPPPPPMCPYSGPPIIDPSTLPSCSTAGGAHCLKASLVPSTMASQLAPCAGGTDLCVPDVFIASAGNYVPKSCTSLDNAEGRCLHTAIPQVTKQSSQLTQDVCAAYEKCVPCYNPVDGMPTGSCKLSCDPGPVKQAVTFQACCNKGANKADLGKCVPKTVIPMSLQSNLGTDSCANSQADLCVPTENLAPDFKPPACTGQGLIGGSYTGVCLSKCLQFGFIQQLGISQGSCDNLHDCAPCTNPLTGQPTGAPGCP